MSPDEIIGQLISESLTRTARRPLFVGLCGAQGSGKSTIAQTLAARFPRCAALSLDDLYLTRAERIALSQDVHPLFATRGVPGTHDMTLGLATFDALAEGRAVRLPRFDKGADDRAPANDWPAAPFQCDLVLFEGWCVGAAPQTEGALLDPINALERVEDGDGRWREAVNKALGGAYQTLFARLDTLILLAAPDWETVGRWREEQEARLRENAPDAPQLMSEAAVTRFIAHYERLSRHILDEMPDRADLVLWLNPDRSCSRVQRATRGDDVRSGGGRGPTDSSQVSDVE